jgi:two-component system OmpR family response regulator
MEPIIHSTRMTAFRVLHVDDEPSIRDIVELALGREAIAVAQDWLPDIIVLDVMMPDMDGPATLAHLKQNVRTAHIPVVFMTGRMQDREVRGLRSLGAVGVIAKPFDPLTLGTSVRSHLKSAEIQLGAVRESFLRRVADNVKVLAKHRPELEAGTAGTAVLEDVRRIAHGLAGAGGIFGFTELGDAAAVLEDMVSHALSGEAGVRDVPAILDRLTACATSILPSEQI